MITYKEEIVADKPVATIVINNGDLEALKNAMEKYSFINQEALLRYALVVLLTTTDNKLYVKNDDGNVAAMNINEKLIKKSI